MTKWPKNGLPKARSADLITERIGDEIVAYDGLTSEAHCLGALASVVFVAADGETALEDLALIATAELNDTVDVAQIERAIAELEQRGLILATETPGISRRQLMQRGAAVGGAAVAASLVTSVVTPAYGATGSGFFPDSLSGIGVVLDCCGTYYYMKWENDPQYVKSLTGAPYVCGPSGSDPGNCNPLPSYPSGQVSTACAPGANLEFTYTPGTSTPTGVRITWNGSCTVAAWEVKCGHMRDSACPGYNTGSSVNVNGLWSSGSTATGGYLDIQIPAFCG